MCGRHEDRKLEEEVDRDREGDRDGVWSGEEDRVGGEGYREIGFMSDGNVVRVGMGAAVEAELA